MWNEKITYGTPIAGKWGYDPVKYWPNEYGNNAIAEDADKVSFFAYAPYVVVTPSTGKAQDQTFGITQLSRNSATGDPYVKYIASFDWEKAVDLLWGVCDNPSWDIVAGENQQINNGAAGLPWLDVQRPLEAKTQAEASQRVAFNFKHALSKLNVTVDYDMDDDEENSTNKLDATTRVYVRSVTFTGFAMKGTLNLNNTLPNIPNWMAYDAINDLDAGEETTVYDGRRDGREGSSGAVASNEQNAFLNPVLIQTNVWLCDNKGVQEKAQNLFKFPGAELVAADMLKGSSATMQTTTLTEDAYIAYGIAGATYYTDTKGAVPGVTTLGVKMLEWPVMVIPNGDEITVTIVYDVETVDAKLATTVSDNTNKGSSIENKITKTITFSGAEKNYMEAGKKYAIHLHLGLNSVKFEANVENWAETAIEGDTWLPANAKRFEAPGIYDYMVEADKSTITAAAGELTLIGFSPYETLKVELATTPALVMTPADGSSVSADGEIDITSITGFDANGTVLNQTLPNAVKVTGNTSGKQIVFNLIQLAAQPAVSSTATKSSDFAIDNGEVEGTFTLKDGNSTTALDGAVWKGDTRNVTILSAYRNGNAMTEVAESETPSGFLQFNCSDATGKIKLGAAATSGEVFIFTIKAGDAGPVTIKFTVL